MQGNKEVIDYMNQLLAGELAARDQYFIHSRMYDEWGYTKLFDANHHASTTKWKTKPATPPISSAAS